MSGKPSVDKGDTMRPSMLDTLRAAAHKHGRLELARELMDLFHHDLVARHTDGARLQSLFRKILAEAD